MREEGLDSRRFGVGGAAAVLTLAALLAGCGGGNAKAAAPTTTTSTTTTTTTTTTVPAGTGSSSAATAAIRKDWVAFFDAKTPTAQRVALLQHGTAFRSAIAADAGSPLAKAASARVEAVTVDSATRATVTYDIVVAGQPALTNQKGTALLIGGTWKVGDASFCSLLGLQGKPPAACGTAASTSGAG